jgi:IS5 family transposase
MLQTLAMSIQETARQLPMFELRFADRLNPDHELLRAAQLIDWDGLHESLSSYYSPFGRSGKPIRLMVGLHILKHRYNCSDERAVEELHENAYWQCFCGFETFQTKVLLDATSLVKFRNRLGCEGMKQIEAVLFKTWRDMGLVRTKKVAVDTTAQPKNIAYPTDADLLHRVREKIVRHMKRVREEVTLRKPFRSFTRVSKRMLLGIKKFHRRDPDKRAQAVQGLQRIVSRVVHQANRVVHTLYVRRRKDLARPLHQLAATGLRIVRQTAEVLQGEKPGKRLYSLHETEVAVIKKGKSHPECEFGSVVAMAMNEDGLIVAHEEYQTNPSDSMTLNPLLRRVQTNTGRMPMEVDADRGFSRSLVKEERWRKRVGLKWVAIPRRGKCPHPHGQTAWFKRGLRRRVKIEPVIGHLKNDHRLNRCRYKGAVGDTANVVWAAVAWNTKKVALLSWLKGQKQAQREVRLAV